MGWDGIKLGKRTARQIIDEWYPNPVAVYEECNHGEQVFFLAMRCKDNPEQILAVIVLVERRGDMAYFKEMDETVHPYYYCNSALFMEELTDLPLDRGYNGAREWRKRSWTRATGGGVAIGKTPSI